ncbi:tautomerase family protein [Acidipropionibacterium jensenii]|uniref:tautomerase family protein n=1 Tax=Acidipropionibacterium jensenii TaxID=1749 RepID=UPI000BC30E58|nr:tautomerase family protein [Acidipropionibacterium jensenii]AZZ40974.1 tautomerase family protein [Acidipropionibacterium jensenii]
MPLVRIDLNKGRTPESIRAIADAIHTALVGVYGIPGRDRFQIITQHDEGEIIAQDAGLGFERDSGVVMVHIFTQQGRSDKEKEALFAGIAGNLEKAGVPPEDVFIGYFENTHHDWSFGFGRSQYVDGELAVPKSGQ